MHQYNCHVIHVRPLFYSFSLSLFVWIPQRYAIDGGDKSNQRDAVHLLTMSVSLEVKIKIILRTLIKLLIISKYYYIS